jgi:hypothetical protein
MNKKRLAAIAASLFYWGGSDCSAAARGPFESSRLALGQIADEKKPARRPAFSNAR